ncbi:MAG TPA: aminotransferase class IV [Verrucomicrobiae bacterium]|nr:aminotransferase class IV [Verrucomicrobiae bacterium]
MFVFLNGRFVREEQALIPVSDRGFLLGDGLFETIRVAGGRPFRLAQHLQRMARGAEALKIDMPFTSPELEAFAGQLVGQNQLSEAVLRVTLTRGPGGRGYTPDACAHPTVVMTLHPAPETPPHWKLATSSFRIPSADPLAAYKTTGKILNVMARAGAVEQGADEALLLNTDGEAVETAGGNLFWIHNGTVCTPPAGGILRGITRDVVLEICRARGLPASERAIKLEALREAPGIFVSQSVFGVVPVTSLDGRAVAPSPLVDPIRSAYGELLARH